MDSPEVLTVVIDTLKIHQRLSDRYIFVTSITTDLGHVAGSTGFFGVSRHRALILGFLEHRQIPFHQDDEKRDDPMHWRNQFDKHCVKRSAQLGPCKKGTWWDPYFAVHLIMWLDSRIGYKAGEMFFPAIYGRRPIFEKNPIRPIFEDKFIHSIHEENPIRPIPGENPIVTETVHGAVGSFDGTSGDNETKPYPVMICEEETVIENNGHIEIFPAVYLHDVLSETGLLSDPDIAQIIAKRAVEELRELGRTH